MMQDDREKALAKRALANMERLSTGTRGLPPLIIGDSVVVQNQTGNYPSRWDITGVVVEVREHNQYVIKVDGSGRMTLRNRKFLQKMTQYQNLKHCRPDTRTQPLLLQHQQKLGGQLEPAKHWTGWRSQAMGNLMT